jgi:hypothetical protein
MSRQHEDITYEILSAPVTFLVFKLLYIFPTNYNTTVHRQSQGTPTKNKTNSIHLPFKPHQFAPGLCTPSQALIHLPWITMQLLPSDSTPTHSFGCQSVTNQTPPSGSMTVRRSSPDWCSSYTPRSPIPVDNPQSVHLQTTFHNELYEILDEGGVMGGLCVECSSDIRKLGIAFPVHQVVHWPQSAVGHFHGFHYLNGTVIGILL